jgi:hypothetical protein
MTREMNTVVELGIGVALFVLAYRGYVGRWPWRPPRRASGEK